MIQLSFKKILIIITSILLSTTNFTSLQGQDEKQSKLVVVYPKPNQIISDQNGFGLTLGRVYKKIHTLLIDSESVELSEEGSFLHYARILLQELNDSIYLSPEKYIQGYFQYELISEDAIDTFLLPVRLTKPLRTLPEDKLRIDNNYPIEPSENLILNTGEILVVKLKATPNCKAYFTIEGEKEKYPMTETFLTDQFYLGEAVFGSGFKILKDTIKGIYTGHVIISDKKWIDKKIKITLEHNFLGKKEFELPSKVSVNQNNQFRIVKVLKEQNPVIGRTGPMLGYRLFLPEGVKAICDGERSGFYRLRLSSNQIVYIPKTSAEFLPEGTLPPRSTVEVIRTKDDGEFVRVEIGLHEKLPYEIKQSKHPHSLMLKIFNAISNIDWIFYDRNQNLVKNISWNQVNDNELEIKILINQKHLWGYYIDYEGNILVLKIKKAPKIQKKFLFFGNPLKGIKIALDPGHNPEDGAVGPSGLKEKDINLHLAKVIKDVLEKEGAKVFLTRVDDPLPLRERKSKVLSFSPHFSISIHNNAVPDGVDPTKHNGFSVYYYNQNAIDFSFILHEKFKEKLNLPDFGLYWDNLYMCRIPETVAVLIEPTFIIHPKQELLLKQEEFQVKLAESIKEALLEFLESVREP